MSRYEPGPEDPLPELEFASGPSPYAGPAVIDEYRPGQRNVLVPILLFLATCYTTYSIGGPWYAVPLMVTLTAHEFGHFLQAVRYRVPASLPYFIPMPFPPLGTMGAVIVFRGNMGDRKALFDIGITGPLAGLIPALIFSIVGLRMSEVVATANGGGLVLGEPLVFHWLAKLVFGPLPDGFDIALSPVAMAGWVGLFVTALNLIPIGQLDGGHILYALLRRKAHVVAQLLLLGGFVYMVWSHNMSYFLIFMLLAFFGVRHPPTANDHMPLGRGRIVLGWLTLLFIFIGFTPQPFMEVRQVPRRGSRPDLVSAPSRPGAAAKDLLPVPAATPAVRRSKSCDQPSRPITIGTSAGAARFSPGAAA